MGVLLISLPLWFRDDTSWRQNLQYFFYLVLYFVYPMRDQGDTMRELLEKIMRGQASFPAAQRLVAAYVLNNCYQIPFLSITVLAKNIGVSDSTIINRFCL